MSTVVIVRKDSRVAIAADSLATSGSTKINAKYARGSDKIMRHADSYLGLVGDVAHAHVLASILAKHRKRVSFAGASDIFETFRLLHPILKEEYFINTSEEEHDPYESSQVTLVIANPHGIFEVGSWREVIEYERFWAVGSGRDYAIGAMYAVYDSASSADEVAEIGVTAGCEFDDGSGLPFTSYATAINEDAPPKKSKSRRR